MTEDTISKIDKMIKHLRDMKADTKRQQKLSEKDFNDMTPRQCERRNADADWLGMAQIKRKHELHALAVELGFAERRDSYEQIELRTSWHRFNYKPREPD